MADGDDAPEGPHRRQTIVVTRDGEQKVAPVIGGRSLTIGRIKAGGNGVPGAHGVQQRLAVLRLIGIAQAGAKQQGRRHSPIPQATSD